MIEINENKQNENLFDSVTFKRLNMMHVVDSIHVTSSKQVLQRINNVIG